MKHMCLHHQAVLSSHTCQQQMLPKMYLYQMDALLQVVLFLQPCQPANPVMHGAIQRIVVECRDAGTGKYM